MLGLNPRNPRKIVAPTPHHFRYETRYGVILRFQNLTFSLENSFPVPSMLHCPRFTHSKVKVGK